MTARRQVLFGWKCKKKSHTKKKSVSDSFTRTGPRTWNTVQTSQNTNITRASNSLFWRMCSRRACRPQIFGPHEGPREPLRRRRRRWQRSRHGGPLWTRARRKHELAFSGSKGTLHVVFKCSRYVALVDIGLLAAILVESLSQVTVYSDFLCNIFVGNDTR